MLLLDQTALPYSERTLEIRSVRELVDAIRRMSVRGGPAIGVAAAFGVLLELDPRAIEDGADFVGRVRESAALLARSRPTARNLFWALERMVARSTKAAGASDDPQRLRAALVEEARAIQSDDEAACEKIGALGARLLANGMRVFTHCNTGALATAGIGTALAPIYAAARAGVRVRVWVGETRPLLQGSRLTAWELARSGIDATLVVDAAAARLFQLREVDAVLVGADRIARNGDVVNKIGTYALALIAERHGVPFYVAASLSTFDLALASGTEIEIEERSAEEVTRVAGRQVAPDGLRAFNPAFDVTPAELVSAIVTEEKILGRPYEPGIRALLQRGFAGS